VNEPGRTLFVAALCAWIGILAVTMLAARLLERRLGRRGAWPALRIVLPLSDLAGTWAGTVAVVALFLGRRGYTWGWATAVGLVCLMVTASLYDRAVLMPSLEAAGKRLDAAEGAADEARWESDRHFLVLMAAWARGGSLAAAVGALAASGA
jgi:hypothetical protein